MSKTYVTNTVTAKLYKLVGSPVEMVLATALFDGLSGFYEHWRCWVYSDTEIRDLTWEDLRKRGTSMLGLVPQFSIPQVGRVDFAIVIPALSLTTPLVVVECDGHDFHERTKEQASKDKKRDRELTKLGIPCLRFTGTDVMQQAQSAVSEILDLMNDRARALEQRWWIEIGDEANKNAPELGGMYVPYEWPLFRTDGKDQKSK